jgi:general secretion pathway protein J
MRMSAARGAWGFTLVEVMVALTLLSLVLLATVTGLRTLGNTQASLNRATDRVDEIRTVSGFLRDLMESAIVGGKGGLTTGGGALESTYFRLGGGALEWKTNLLFGEAYGGTHIVRVAAEGDQLVLRWLEPEHKEPGPEKWRNAPSRLLVEDLGDFRVSMREQYSSPWENHWEDEFVAPALVRIQLQSSGRYWPDLIMQVQR